MNLDPRVRGCRPEPASSAGSTCSGSMALKRRQTGVGSAGGFDTASGHQGRYRADRHDNYAPGPRRLAMNGFPCKLRDCRKIGAWRNVIRSGRHRWRQRRTGRCPACSRIRRDDRNAVIEARSPRRHLRERRLRAEEGHVERREPAARGLHDAAGLRFRAAGYGDCRTTGPLLKSRSATPTSAPERHLRAQSRQQA